MTSPKTAGRPQAMQTSARHSPRARAGSSDASAVVARAGAATQAVGMQHPRPRSRVPSAIGGDVTPRQTPTSAPVTSAAAERAIFELEELQVRLNCARARSAALSARLRDPSAACLTSAALPKDHASLREPIALATPREPISPEPRRQQRPLVQTPAAAARDEHEDGSSQLSKSQRHRRSTMPECRTQTLPAAEEQEEDAGLCESIEMQALELERLLQMATLRREALLLRQPLPEALAGHSPPPPPQSPGDDYKVASEATPTEDVSPLVVTYLSEKVDECLSERKRFFDRYLFVRNALFENPRSALDQPDQGTPTPVLSVQDPSGQRARASISALHGLGTWATPPSGAVHNHVVRTLLERERSWFAEDAASLSDRVSRAERQHRAMFLQIARLERQAAELEASCAESRRLDSSRIPLLRAAGVVLPSDFAQARPAEPHAVA